MTNRAILCHVLLCALMMAGGSAGVAQQPFGMTSRPKVGDYMDGYLLAPPGSTPPEPLVPVNAFPNLTFQNPMGMVQMPGTNLLVVWEREGTVRAFPKDPAASTTTLLLNISSRCQGWDDCGIVALAYHPQFSLGNATHRHVYLWYTWNPPGTIKGSAAARPAGYPYVVCWNRLSRFDVTESGVILPETELVMIHQKCKTVWHKGGGMFFHPTNGFLYLTVGEDFDQTVNAQRVDRGLFGGVLRIDVDMIGGTTSHPIPRQPLPGPDDDTGSYSANYYIPNDNPLVGQPNTLEEFYVIGLRSPDEMTYDSVSGRIFISDVGDYGPTAREEINVIEPGEVTAGMPLNFQWHKVQGFPTAPLTGLYSPSLSKNPKLAYAHAENGNVAAVMGGFVYRGAALAATLGGKYVFADNMSGKVWTLDESTNPAGKNLIAMLPNGPGVNRGQNYLGISSFALDAAGELYLCRLSNEGGGIFKLAPNTGVGFQLQNTLSKTKLFSNMLNRTPSTKLIPYTLNHPFWSDGALKCRWMAIPHGGTEWTKKIGFSETGEWTFPEGSVLVKHFDLRLSDVATSPVRRLETRVIAKTASGIVAGTYKWQADRLNAKLVTDTTFEDIKITIRGVGTPAGYNLGGTTSPAGSSSQTSTKLVINGSGSGIGSTGDQARFNYVKRTGDFDFFVRVESLAPSVGGTTPLATVGLIARSDFTPGSACAGVSAGMTTDNVDKETTAFQFHVRSTSAASMSSTPPPDGMSAAYPHVWLRLKRTGNDFTAYVARNAVDWEAIGNTTLAGAPAEMLWGVVCSANEAGKRAKATVHFQTKRVQRWTFPGQTSCMACHTANAGWILGPNSRQMNCNAYFANTKVTDNQIRAWNNVGLFDQTLTEGGITGLDKLVALSNTAATLEARARSYLDSNCGYCHRPGGVNALWDGRWTTPLGSQGLLNGNPLNDLDIAGAKLIAPGNPDLSLIHYRTDSLGGHQMPPLGKNRIDLDGAALLKEWILSLPP
ncbi:MAG: PQQ-dependent sugar dehydrogenase [Verrucomicrobiaceae bacterium]|nr:PQQ-dependent sugar dehydrogenase [Verrucomicrobiaceae bacterium]